MKIRKTERRQSERSLPSSMTGDIRAVRMFAPVVVFLFLCNIEPMIATVLWNYKKIVYRELYIGLGLASVLNSSVNLPIYYLKGESLREEIRGTLKEIMDRFPQCSFCWRKKREVEITVSKF